MLKIPAFKMFQDLVSFESSQDLNPPTTVVIISNHEKKAKKWTQASINVQIKTYEYNHKNGKISTTDLLKKSCSCRYCADRCMCYHLIFVAILEKVSIPGMAFFDKFS